MDCPRCGSINHRKDGIVGGRQRHYCKDCHYRYTVQQKSNTKSAATRRLALEMYLEGLGFRAIGRILKISHTIVYYWVKEWGERVALPQKEGSVSVVELDETPQYLSIPAILGQVVSLKAFSISGPSSVCDQATYTVENLPQGATVQWSVSNNNVTLTSGQGTHTATFTKFRNGMEIIHADILFNNIRIALLTKETYFGAPSISNIIGEQRVPTGQYASYRAVISNNAPIPSSYQWILNPLNGNSLYGNGTESIDIAFYNPGSYQLVCRATNECGVGDYYTMGIGVYDNLYLTLSPNPATDEVTLQLMETDEVSGLSVLSTDRSAYEIQIWSGMRMLRSFRTNEPTFQISMAGLPAGLYFVRVVKNGQTYTQKLIKK